MKGKIAVIGDKNIVQVFKTFGADVFPSEHSIEDIAGKEYAVILTTENELYKTGDKPYPIILPIPNGVRHKAR